MDNKRSRRTFSLWSQSLRTVTLIAWLCVWPQRTAAQGPGADVVTAAVGQTATLTAPATAGILTFSWYRGTAVTEPQLILSYLVSGSEQTNGPQHTGLETGQPDGSLRIRDLTTNYSGDYTVNVIDSKGKPTQATRRLRVYERVSVPVIHAMTPNPIENGSLVLFCNASGTDISYEWYQEQKRVVAGGRISLTNNSQILTLSPCTRNDTGTVFTCRAYNAVSNSTSTAINVTISYGPDTPVISVSPEKPFYTTGGILTLTCTAASYPPAQYSWLLNGQSLAKTEQKLLINPLTQQDSGNYTCNTSNSVTHLSKHAIWGIRILENVSIPVIQAMTLNPVENGSLVLVCNASGTDVSYQWYQDDKLITSGGKINITSNNQTLTFSPCTRNDTGTSFTCRASNAVSHSTSSQYILTVSYGPDTPVISAGPEEPVYQTDSALTLSCTAASYPPALYTWLLNRQSLLKTGPDLRFNSLTLTDSGNYTCNASNNVTHLSNQATWGIRVLEPVSKPTVTYVPSQLVENRGPAEITCNNSKAASTILWSFNNSPTLPGNIIQSADNRTLTISNVSRGDSGIYQCTAMNPVSSSTSDPQTLTVAYGPENVRIEGPVSHSVQNGTKLSLSCIAGSFPEPQYKWFLNDTDLKRPGNTYTVDKVSSRDNGNYTCVVHNDVTGLSAKASFYIVVTEHPPDQPNNGLSGGAIAGIVIAVLVVLAGVAALLYFFVFKKPASGAAAARSSTEMTSNNKAAAAGPKANGTPAEIEYSSVNFVPKQGTLAKPTSPENTVYSEVRR